MSQKDLPELLTLKQTCEVLQVHPNTLRNWDKSGLLVSTRIGIRGVRRYSKADIEKFIKNGKKTKK